MLAACKHKYEYNLRVGVENDRRDEALAGGYCHRQIHLVIPAQHSEQLAYNHNTET